LGINISRLKIKGEFFGVQKGFTGPEIKRGFFSGGKKGVWDLLIWGEKDFGGGHNEMGWTSRRPIKKGGFFIQPFLFWGEKNPLWGKTARKSRVDRRRGHTHRERETLRCSPFFFFFALFQG